MGTTTRVGRVDMRRSCPDLVWQTLRPGAPALPAQVTVGRPRFACMEEEEGVPLDLDGRCARGI